MTMWQNEGDKQHQDRTGQQDSFQSHDRLMRSFRQAHSMIEPKSPAGAAASWMSLPLIWQVKAGSYRQN